MKKLKSIKGETLVETMIAVLIIALALTFLPSAIVASARVNRSAENVIAVTDVTAPDYASRENGITVTMTYRNDLSSFSTVDDCDLHWNGEGDGGLYYYD